MFSLKCQTFITSYKICLGSKIFYGQIQFVDDVISSHSGVSAALLETRFLRDFPTRFQSSASVLFKMLQKRD